MYNRYLDLVRKTFMGLGLAMICGGFNACKDDYDLDDEGNYPSWLGSSIYEALKDPASLESSGNATLTGTFNNYVRLIEDLGEAETTKEIQYLKKLRTKNSSQIFFRDYFRSTCYSITINGAHCSRRTLRIPFQDHAHGQLDEQSTPVLRGIPKVQSDHARIPV